jgi:hypothetical protein
MFKNFEAGPGRPLLKVTVHRAAAASRPGGWGRKAPRSLFPAPPIPDLAGNRGGNPDSWFGLVNGGIGALAPDCGPAGILGCGRLQP